MIYARYLLVPIAAFQAHVPPNIASHTRHIAPSPCCCMLTFLICIFDHRPNHKSNHMPWRSTCIHLHVTCARPLYVHASGAYLCTQLRPTQLFFSPASSADSMRACACALRRLRSHHRIRVSALIPTPSNCRYDVSQLMAILAVAFTCFSFR
jgi:hypothetical protein